jgi:hypothetical protein
VLSFDYAEKIARDWNSTREDAEFTGYVTRFEIDDGDMPPESVEKIATTLGVSEQDVVSMNRRLSGGDHSLNAPLRKDGDGEWMDWLEDDSDNQETMVAEADELDKRRALLTDAMSTLNERERHILTERRLKDDPMTLEDLSKVYDISRERVRQIEVRAFETSAASGCARSRSAPSKSCRRTCATQPASNACQSTSSRNQPYQLGRGAARRPSRWRILTPAHVQ